MRPVLLSLVGLIILLANPFVIGCGATRSTSSGVGSEATFQRQDPFEARSFQPLMGERWIGNAIAYGPFRDGQHPGGPSPTRGELREDLRLISEHWGLLRMYGAAGAAETVLELILEDNLDLRVMLGIWIAVEEVERHPDAAAANRREIESAVRLAATYPEIVIAVSVGNETQVSWSAHRSPQAVLINYIREVRARIQSPVTVADDFNFWNKPESHAVAQEVDFIVMHAHPLWNGIQIEDAPGWTEERFKEVQAVHPGHTIVLGETGWATRKHTEGEQARLIKGRPGEEEQQVFYTAVTAWADRERTPVFFFEAFDENWKGGEHPDGVEKHWGLFRADRTPKQAVMELDP